MVMLYSVGSISGHRAVSYSYEVNIYAVYIYFCN